MRTGEKIYCGIELTDLMESNILEKMKTEGWLQQFTASGARLQEAIDNYRDLGFEVRTIPFKKLITNGCAVCMDEENDETMMIFTRKAGKETKKKP
jgi:hypothetical protein